MMVNQELLSIDIKISTLINDHLNGRKPSYVFDEIALEIHQFQFNNSDLYRNFCENNSIPMHLSSMVEVPFFNVDEFKGKSFPDTSCIKSNNGMFMETSGTTKGISGKIYRDDGYFKLRRETIICQGNVCWFKRYIPNKVKIIFLDIANRRNLSGFKKEYSVLNTIKEDFGSSESCFLNIFHDFHQILDHLNYSYTHDMPIVIISPSYYLSNFILKAKEEHISVRLQKNSLVMDSGGLKNNGKHLSMSEYKQDLYGLFGISDENYINTYAMTEIGAQFSNHPPSEYKEIPPWTKISIIDDNNNQCLDNAPGTIVIYDLLNRTNIFGVKTTDIGMLNDGLLKVLGRSYEK